MTEHPPRRTQTATLPDASTVSQLDPEHVRVIEILGENESFQRDCYDPNGGLEEETLEGIEKLFQTIDGRLYVCTIDWARSASLNPSVELHWVSTGMQVHEVDQIRVYSWPDGELLRIFRHTP